MADEIYTTPEFTPNWNGEMPYTSDLNFNSVIFPEQAPLLGMDLNEMQAIQNDLREKFIAGVMTNGIIYAESGWWEDRSDIGTHTLKINNPACLVVCVNGKILTTTGGNVATLGLLKNEEAYLKFVRKTVDYTSVPYLAENAFEEEISRRERWEFAEITKSAGSEEGALYVKVFYCGVPVYSRIKTYSVDTTLIFNNFIGGTIEEDVTPDGLERYTETQTDIFGRLIATKVTIFSQDNSVITETLKIAGDDKTYEKTTTFATDENGKETIEYGFVVIQDALPNPDDNNMNTGQGDIYSGSDWNNSYEW